MTDDAVPPSYASFTFDRGEKRADRRFELLDVPEQRLLARFRRLSGNQRRLVSGLLAELTPDGQSRHPGAPRS